MTMVSEFFAGVGLLARGLALIVRRPRMFLLGALPPLITSVLFTIAVVIAVKRLPELVAGFTGFADTWNPGTASAVRALIGVALLAGLVLILVISFTALTLALGSPIYDKLSEYCEAEFGDVPEFEEPLRTGAVRAVRQSIGLILTSMLAAIVLFAAGFIPLVGQVVVPVVSACVGGWLLAVELVGSAFERRGLLRIGDRRAALRTHRARVLGFAVPTFLLLAIPFAGAIVFPVATAGGTLLARELLNAPTRRVPPPADGSATPPPDSA